MTTKERIAQAVDDNEWQRFRLSLKGLTTRQKLDALHDYYTPPRRHPTSCRDHDGVDLESCNYCIRVDNYIKALCRGGQLFRGESLESMIRCSWNPDIKS